MPASRCRNGSAKAGSIRTIRAAGSSGIAAITWAAAWRTRTPARSDAGRQSAATCGKSRKTVSRAICPAAQDNGRRCCTGPMTAAKFEWWDLVEYDRGNPRAYLFRRDRGRARRPMTPSRTHRIDHDHAKSGGEHLPARPEAGGEIECDSEHTQRRDMKCDADANRLADECENGYSEAEHKQAQRRQFARVLPPDEQPVSDQPKQQTGGKDRHRDVGLGLLEIVDEREQRDRIDRLMQPAPALSAEPAHHAVGRGRSQRGKTEPGRGADDQIDAMADLVHDLAEVEALIRDKERKMGGDIEKCADAEHAPHIDQVAVAGDAPQRRHRQGYSKKHQRPEAGAVDHGIERTRAVDDVAGIKKRLGRWHQQQRQRADAQGGKPPASIAPDLPAWFHGSRLPRRWPPDKSPQTAAE